jgi:hypothetical protein
MIFIEDGFEHNRFVYYYLFKGTLTNKIHFPGEIW